jgi:hypothetical protein
VTEVDRGGDALQIQFGPRGTEIGAQTTEDMEVIVDPRESLAEQEMVPVTVSIRASSLTLPGI